VLARVLALRGTRVGDAKTTASAPLVELTMKGKVVTLRTGAVEGGEVAVKGRDELVQLLPANQKSWLETGVELFKRPKMPPPGSGQIQGLDQLPPDVRAKLEAQLRAQGH
jgi:hypothetical protein